MNTDFAIPVLGERSIEELPTATRIYCRHKQFMKTAKDMHGSAWTHDLDETILKFIGIVEKYYLVPVRKPFVLSFRLKGEIC
jgi:hypothetical protein